MRNCDDDKHDADDDEHNYDIADDKDDSDLYKRL